MCSSIHVYKYFAFNLVSLLSLNHLDMICLVYRRGRVLRSTYILRRSHYENLVMRRRYKANNLRHHTFGRKTGLLTRIARQ